MVAVDHSPQSPQVLDEAIKLAKMSGARLHVVTIANYMSLLLMKQDGVMKAVCKCRPKAKHGKC